MVLKLFRSLLDLKANLELDSESKGQNLSAICITIDKNHPYFTSSRATIAREHLPMIVNEAVHIWVAKNCSSLVARAGPFFGGLSLIFQATATP